MALRTPKLLFYCFVVMVILVRPYLTYQMMERITVKEPEIINNLFQRLIKKKESHTEDFIEATDMAQAPASISILPLVWVILLRRRLNWLFSQFNLISSLFNRTTVFQVAPTNQYFQYISRLQI